MRSLKLSYAHQRIIRTELTHPLGCASQVSIRAMTYVAYI
jgi:hypothetical protein